MVEAMQVTITPIESITRYAGNPRRNAEAVPHVAASIREFGWRQPLVVDADGVIICGDTRYQAAQQLGMDTVPVHVATDLTPDQVKAYRIADNAAAEIATWDADLLETEVAAVKESGDLADDVEQLFMQLLVTDGAGGRDEVVEPNADLTRGAELREQFGTAPDQLWLIHSADGKRTHRLICGDSSDLDTVARLFAGEQPDACISDPPYGINHDCDYKRFGANSNTYIPVAGDDKPFDPTPFTDFKTVILWGFNSFSDRLPPGSLLIWCKRRDEQLGTFMSDCEVAWLKGGHGVYLFHHVWNGRDRESERGVHDHPTQKPVALMAWCIERSKPGPLIFDPFSGTAPVMAAAEQCDRRVVACELVPEYVAIALQRMVDLGCRVELSETHDAATAASRIAAGTATIEQPADDAAPAETADSGGKGSGTATSGRGRSQKKKAAKKKTAKKKTTRKKPARKRRNPKRKTTVRD